MSLTNPSADVNTGTYNNSFTLTLTNNSGFGSIYYTTNGNDPTDMDDVYTAPLTINATTNFKFKNIWLTEESDTITRVYTMVCNTPTIVPTGTSFDGSQGITLSNTTTGTSTYYTLGGTTPTNASTLYSAPFTITATSIVKAISYKTGYTTSAIKTETFTKNPVDPIEEPILTNMSIKQGSIVACFVGSSKLLPLKFGANFKTTLTGRPKQQFVNNKNKITINIDKMSQVNYDKLLDMWASASPVYVTTERKEFLICTFSSDQFDFDNDEDYEGNIFYYGRLELED